MARPRGWRPERARVDSFDDFDLDDDLTLTREDLELLLSAPDPAGGRTR